MSIPQFDSSPFAEGLQDRLKLFSSLEQMTNRSSQALSVGTLNGHAYRIRFVNDNADKIRQAASQKDYDEALQIITKAIQESDVIFEKHAKTQSPSIEAYTSKTIIEKINSHELVLSSRKTGKQIPYNQLVEIQKEQIIPILAAVDTAQPEKTGQAEEPLSNEELVPPAATEQHPEQVAETEAAEQLEETPIAQVKENESQEKEETPQAIEEIPEATEEKPIAEVEDSESQEKEEPKQ
jgi:hypothetical protein